ncbi:MAG: ethanolamine ammonia-lyase [Paenibacillus sp.]|nr:ethanolamine ammonia-lyase [Paenibacillus sp.]
MYIAFHSKNAQMPNLTRFVAAITLHVLFCRCFSIFILVLRSCRKRKQEGNWLYASGQYWYLKGKEYFCERLWRTGVGPQPPGGYSRRKGEAMKLQLAQRGRHYAFRNLAEVMAKANEERSGDRLAGLAAADMAERIAAKLVLADCTLEDIRSHPLLPAEKDEVSRVIEEDVDEATYAAIRNWTVAQLREHLLRTETDGAEMLRLGRGMTSEMIAAVCKLMSNLDLIQAASRMEVLTSCRTIIGQRGTLASRAQPNHPADHPLGMKASMLEALAYGVGDAVIGINPVSDSAETVKRLLHASAEAIAETGAPTQNCSVSELGRDGGGQQRLRHFPAAPAGGGCGYGRKARCSRP